MAGIVGLRAEDMEQVDALRRAKLDWPRGLPLVRPQVLAPVLVRREGELVHVPARFGFSRSFASFNARDDRLASSPFWRAFFGRHHAIAPLSYVVEWVKEAGGGRRAHVIQRRDGGLLFAPAFIGPHRDREGDMAFAIVTREPNAFFAHFHDRMVGQCPTDLMDRWLMPEGQAPEALLECIAAPADDELVAVPLAADPTQRKAGDWSPLEPGGAAIGWADLRRAGPSGQRTLA